MTLYARATLTGYVRKKADATCPYVIEGVRTRDNLPVPTYDHDLLVLLPGYVAAFRCPMSSDEPYLLPATVPRWAVGGVKCVRSDPARRLMRRPGLVVVMEPDPM